MNFPSRTLINPRTFVIEVGEDGFNAYVFKNAAAAITLELFAASSSVSTYMKVMSDIMASNGSPPLKFQVEDGAAKTEAKP